jgi:hypothetical protein
VVGIEEFHGCRRLEPRPQRGQDQPPCCRTATVAGSN